MASVTIASKSDILLETVLRKLRVDQSRAERPTRTRTSSATDARRRGTAGPTAGSSTLSSGRARREAASREAPAPAAGGWTGVKNRKESRMTKTKTSTS